MSRWQYQGRTEPLGSTAPYRPDDLQWYRQPAEPPKRRPSRPEGALVAPTTVPAPPFNPGAGFPYPYYPDRVPRRLLGPLSAVFAPPHVEAAPPAFDPAGGFPYPAYPDFARALRRTPWQGGAVWPLPQVGESVTLDKWFQPTSLPLRNWGAKRREHWLDPFHTGRLDDPPPPAPVPPLSFWQPVGQPYVPRRNPVVAALGAHYLRDAYPEPRPLSIVQTRLLNRFATLSSAVERLTITGTVEARFDVSD